MATLGEFLHSWQRTVIILACAIEALNFFPPGNIFLRYRPNKSSVKMVVGSFVGSIIGLAFLPLLARIYDTSVFGFFVVINTFLQLYKAIGGLGFEQKLPSIRNEQEAIEYYHAIIFFGFIFSIVVTVVIVVIQATTGLLENYFSLDLSVLFLLTLLILSSANLIRNVIIWQVRAKKFDDLSSLRTFEASGRTGGQILLGLLSPSILSLTISENVADLTQIWASRRNLPKVSKLFRMSKAKSMFLTVIKYRKFAAYNLASAVLGRLTTDMPLYIVSFLFGSHAAGLYAMVLRVLLSPIRIIAGPISRIVLGNSADLMKNQAALSDYYRNIVKVQAASGFIIYFFLGLVAYLFLPWLLGAKWQAATPLVPTLAFYCFLTYFMSIIASAYNILDLYKINTIIDLIYLLGLGLLIIAYVVLEPDLVMVCVGFTVVRALYVFYKVYKVLAVANIRKGQFVV